MPRGGMRFGAGRPAMHIKAENCKRIDVRRWHREGILAGWRMGSWQWTDAQSGERLATIGYRFDGDSVALDYSIDGKDCSQRIRLSYSACNYGGARPWFLCPIRGERVAVLYLRAGRFACRHCQRLAYASQSDDAIGRGWRRQQKIEAKLGDNWKRPKGMHRTTHERLMSIIWDYEEKREAELSRFLAGMLDRYPSLRDDPMLQGLA